MRVTLRVTDATGTSYDWTGEGPLISIGRDPRGGGRPAGRSRFELEERDLRQRNTRRIEPEPGRRRHPAIGQGRPQADRSPVGGRAESAPRDGIVPVAVASACRSAACRSGESRAKGRTPTHCPGSHHRLPHDLGCGIKLDLDLGPQAQSGRGSGTGSPAADQGPGTAKTGTADV